MYRWLRNTHLLLGVFSAVFVLMYGVSAVQMAYPEWFALRPKVTETRIPIPREHSEGPRPAARWLMEREGMRGELAQARQTPSGYSFRIVRPGTVYEVAYGRDTGTAQVRTSVAGFLGMLNRIHHIGGLWHGLWVVNAWGALVGLVSLALLVIGVTGIYLWFKIHEERLAGAALLVLSLAWSLTLLALLRAA